MKKLSPNEYAKEDEVLAMMYRNGTSACEISRQSESLFGRKLSVSRITTRLKRNGVVIEIKAWNKGINSTNDTTGRTSKWLETFHKNASKHKYGRPCSEETKRKISNSRKEYLRKNPDKVGYKLNHSSKESYPEKYFAEAFKAHGANLQRYVRIGLFCLDFCDIDKKIDIEIDGGTHTLPDVIDKDKRRDKQLQELGWKIIRICWSDFMKLSTEERENKVVTILKDLKL